MIVKIAPLLCFLFAVIGCSSQEVVNYVNKKGTLIEVNVPYSVLSRIEYKQKYEPYIICLREEYALRYGKIDMHLEHSDLRVLYGNAFNLSLQNMQKISDEDLIREVEEWYIPKKRSKDTMLSLKGVFNASIVQKIDSSGTISTVVIDERIIYELELRDNKWVIVKKEGSNAGTKHNLDK